MTDQKSFKNKYFFVMSFVIGFFFFGCGEEDALTAALEITESPLYDFGSVTTGTSLDHTFTITNSGVVAATNIEGLELDAPFSYKDGFFPGTGGTCGTTLDIEATCDVVLSFEPTATTTSTDSLYIRYNNGTVNRILELDLTGEGATGGAGTAMLVISDGPTYDFGTVNTGNTSDHTFTVTNTGTVSATGVLGSGLAAPFSFSGGAYPGTGGTCALTVAAAASCTIVVQFAPVIVGIFSDTINMDYNDGVAAQTANRDIQGTGQ